MHIPPLPLLLLPLALLAGCDGLSESDFDRERSEHAVEARILDAHQVMAVASASPDYATSDIALVTNVQASSAILFEGQFATTSPNDIGISTHADALYRLGRFQADSVTKYSLGSHTQPFNHWQYSVQGEDASANPYSLTFINDEKAVLIRYDAPTAWLVNPSVTGGSEADFKLGELDLSAYAHEGSGGTPRAADALIVDDRLYILMQRLDSDFQATQSSYVAVFDLPELTEVDTNSASELMGIELPVRNAANLSHHNGTLFVAGRGNTAWGAEEGVEVRGLVAIDTSTHDAELIYDGSQVEFEAYGSFERVVIAGDHHGFFVGRASWGNDTLYHFNPASPEQSITAVEGLTGVSIADVKFNALTDADAVYQNLLYVAIQPGFDTEANGRIVVVNSLDQRQLAEINMLFNPTSIEFLSR